MHDDNQQFWDLLKPLHRAAEAFSRMLAGNRDDGDDLYQEAVCRALPRLGQLRDPDAFRPWFYRVIVNCHRNRVTAPWWRRFERLKPEHDLVVSPERVAGPIHARMRLAVAMKPLSVQDRALVLLYDVEGWTVSELAGLAGVSEASVRTRLSRARKKMKAALLRYVSSRPGVSIAEWFEKENDLCVAAKRRPE